MPDSYVRYEADGKTQVYLVPFPYIRKEFVKVYLLRRTTLQEIAGASLEWPSASTLRLPPAPAVGTLITIKRETDRENPETDFRNGSTLIEEDLDIQVTQLLHITQEAFDLVEGEVTKTAIAAVEEARAAAVDALNSRDRAEAAANLAVSYIPKIRAEGEKQIFDIGQEGAKYISKAKLEADRAEAAAALIPGFADNIQTVFAFSVDADGNLVETRSEDGDVLDMREYQGWYIAPSWSYHTLENGDLVVNLLYQQP